MEVYQKVENPLLHPGWQPAAFSERKIRKSEDGRFDFSLSLFPNTISQRIFNAGICLWSLDSAWPTSAEGLLAGFSYIFSLWIKNVRFSRALDQCCSSSGNKCPRHHCDPHVSVIYPRLAGDLCPSSVPSASRRPSVTSRVLQKLLFLKELHWVKKQFPALES